MFAKAYCLLFVKVDMVLQWARAKEEIDLGKTMKGGSSAPNKKTKRLLNIPKLEDGKTITNMAHYGTTLPCVRQLTNTKLYKTFVWTGKDANLAGGRDGDGLTRCKLDITLWTTYNEMY